MMNSKQREWQSSPYFDRWHRLWCIQNQIDVIPFDIDLNIFQFAVRGGGLRNRFHLLKLAGYPTDKLPGLRQRKKNKHVRASHPFIER